MGTPEVNVAYQDTWGDLRATANGLTMDNDEFSQFMAGPADSFTPINSSTGVTVSPQDLLKDSFPPSTSFTNLTTPGSTYMETPEEDYETSPLFTDNLGFNGTGTDNWFSLFPDDNPVSTPAPLMARTTSASSASQIVVHPGGEGNARKRSSTTALSPANAYASPAVRHSDVAGVNARKRDKPLPPIVVDEADTVALKRARNTAAARKSRAKKVQERDEMEAVIADLKDQVEHWKRLALERIGSDEETEA